MAVLSGPEIRRQMDLGKIVIEPFDPEINIINPNSVNLRIGNKLLTYKRHVLDMAIDNPHTVREIPEDGIELRPGTLYLATTMERTITHGLQPKIDGRSSVGRLGLTVHITAGFGDCSFDGEWTLELSCVQPIIIYPFTPICQISYNTIHGDLQHYNGRYQNQVGPRPSAFWKDIRKKESA